MNKKSRYWLGAIAGLLLIATADADASVPGPVVKNVAIDSKVIHIENEIFETDDFQTVISAIILPAPGREALELKQIQVYFQGRLVEFGQRIFNAKSGRFQLTLSSQETMKLASSLMREDRKWPGQPERPLVRIVVTDHAGHASAGVFNHVPESTDMKTHITMSVGYKDAYGRFVRQDDNAADPPTRSLGKTYHLVGSLPAPSAALKLQVASRFPVQPPGELGPETVTRLTPGVTGTVDFTFKDKYETFLATIAADSGRLLAMRPVMAAPKGLVRLARRSSRRIDLLSWTPTHRAAVESTTTGQRVVLPEEPRYAVRGSSPLDFVADSQRVIFTTSDWGLGVEACDWAGRRLWRVDGATLSPDTGFDGADSDAALTLLPDGTVLVLQTSSDDAQPDSPEFFSLSRLSSVTGGVRSTRLMYLPKIAGETRNISSGVAVRMAGHDLVVLNMYHFVGETIEEETVVLDSAEPEWKPLVRLTSPGNGRFTVYGAAVTDNRLVVGCGSSGAALLSVVSAGNGRR